MYILDIENEEYLKHIWTMRTGAFKLAISPLILNVVSGIITPEQVITELYEICYALLTSLMHSTMC